SEGSCNVMKKHIKEFTIHAYKGIQNLKLDQLNYINILTGDNNSGKTSVLELLSTLEHPQNLKTWISCSRVDSIRFGTRYYFNGIYNMFPIDTKKKNCPIALQILIVTGMLFL
ncbi:MAG: AAA family ATPase, partial [Clostridiales bacterium]|nr:AAA family ATPase [Clostridiales bacterium]